MNARSNSKFASLVLVLLAAIVAAGFFGSRSTVALQATPEASPIAGGETVDLIGLVNTPGSIPVADLQTLTPAINTSSRSSTVLGSLQR